MEPDRKLTYIERMLPMAVIVALMSFVAAMSFRAVFDSWIFVLAPLLAAVGATAIGMFGTWRKLLLGEAMALSFVGYLVFGTVAVGGLPVPSSFLALMNGVTNGWITILDSLPPADAAGDLRALPFTAAWLGAALGVEILRRSKRVGLPAIGPLLSLSISILFSLGQRRLVLFQGVLLTVLFLLLVTMQYEAKRNVLGETRKVRPVRVALGATILIAVVAISPFVAGILIPDAPAGRIELRQLRPSPWDPLSVASPLTEVKGYLTGDRKDEVALTITGPAIDRIRIAALEDYDGRVWAVADVASDAPAEFKPAGPSLPGATGSGELVERTVEIHGLATPWLPVVAQTTRVDFPADEQDLQMSLQMNKRTRTLAVPASVGEGTTYTILSYEVPTRELDELETANLGYDSNRFGLELLPPSLQNVAADIVEGIDPGWGQVAALQTYLRDGGFYAEENVLPGHSYARIASFLSTDVLAAPVGYTEQYGAGGAVLARAVNLPSRVVLGFTIPEDRFEEGSADVLFGDVSVWVEILTEEYGWVPVDMTPDESREPERQAASPTTKYVASPNPPPPPPTTTTSTTIPLGADEEIEDQIVEEEPDEPEGLAGLPNIVKAGIVGVSVPIIVILMFAILIIAAKTVTRSRRRSRGDPAARVAGAWYETLDRYREAGYDATPRSTPTELAHEFAGAGASASAVGTLEELATQVDRAAFHPEEPSDERAEVAWEISDAAVQEVHREHTVWQRLKMAVNPATILRPSRRGNPAGEKRSGRRRRSSDVR